jgi:pimeloyl-ACP methyl ester carboxylesterase
MVILAGEDDKTAPVAGCEAILRSYGTSEARKGMKKLIEVGHWHCVEDPEAVQSIVGEFLEGLE